MKPVLTVVSTSSFQRENHPGHDAVGASRRSQPGAGSGLGIFVPNQQRIEKSRFAIYPPLVKEMTRSSPRNCDIVIDSAQRVFRALPSREPLRVS